MKWRKLGQVYDVASGPYTHAMHPVAEVLDAEDGRVRIYYTHRGEDNVGFTSFLEARIKNDVFSITYNHEEPIFERGALGNFDDSGVCVTCMLKIGDVRRFYYYGWNLGVTVPFRNAVGVAEAEGDGHRMKLRRLFPGPILDRAPQFPGLCATPFVLNDGVLFRAYFAQGTPWLMKKGRPCVACDIGCAESRDGINWERTTTPAVTGGDRDHVVTTPVVKLERGVYRMWYSYRGDAYRLGYAESRDGVTFARKDDAVGITVSESGWDNHMVCYPSVFDVCEKRYMIYCGNGYGRDGFGLAVREN